LVVNDKILELESVEDVWLAVFAPAALSREMGVLT